MSLIRYNGVQLNVCKVNRLEQSNVYTADGTDYLYTHFVLHAQCQFNASATTVDKNIGPGSSIPILRQKLKEPRKELLFIIGDIEVLRSPQKIMAGGADPKMTCDAKNGPSPIFVNVVEIDGTENAAVEFAIETWLVDVSHGKNPMIANRWTTEEEIDPLYMSTRRVSGTAHFRTDLLAHQKLQVDDFRKALGHPIPKNFKRDGVRVAVSSDNTTAHYSFADVEQTLNLGQNSPILRIAGTYRQGGGYLNAPSSALSVKVPKTGIKVSAPLPQHVAELSVHVEGRRSCPRAFLHSAIIRLAAGYGFFAFGQGNRAIAYFSKAEIASDIVNKVADGYFQAVLSGDLGNAAHLAGVRTVNIVQMPEDPPGGLGWTVTTGDGPKLLKSGNTRSESLGRLMVQALTTPGEKPTNPPGNEAAKDVQG